jgi:glycosyltransferase involved in cell wall biosynthesis
VVFHGLGLGLLAEGRALKLCIVSQSALPALSPAHKHGHLGGAEVQLALLARALARQGHEVSLVVAATRWPTGPGEPWQLQGIRLLRSFEPEAGWPVWRFIHPRGSGLWRALRQADADTYLCSTAGVELAWMAAYCRLHGKRLVFRVASDSDCDPARLLVRWARDRWLYHRGLHAADAVLVQSAVQMDLLARHHGIRGVQVRGLVDAPASVPPAGAAEGCWRTSEASDAPIASPIDALWVANLRALKRPEMFLALARAHPALRFHMAGGPSPGEEALFDVVRREALGIPNLHFHGPVPYLDIGALFDRARLLVNTSRVEGFPNTFLQAWVRGIPVLTTFDPDGLVAREGLGVHAADADAAHALHAGLKALQHPPSHAEASRRAIAYMHHHHGAEDVLAPYLAALQPTLRRHLLPPR